MAQVFKSVNGRKLTKLIALHETVQKRLDTIALEKGVQAQAKLDAHKVTGAARIDVEQGRVDRYVVLNDERGLSAALSIEYGRDADSEGRGAMRGLYILHDTFGLRGR
ncbi:DUF5403 family protein [Rhodococcus antarcticus]|uniref:DUF5403 family protein n=1 Tax=Rhodococcus antarcticus TaxID=2987751 RepID=A0ABY6P4P5_9NOCA|nr:DUF5403 family protein [Rhodococcus antarcticus]UZJ26627.1 DUF5403 family protein [Rhodococcus antarcticus]